METVKCRFCKKEINKEGSYKVGDRTYYCCEEHYKKQLDKNKYKPNRTKSNGEPNDRRELTDYIQKIYVEYGYDKHFIPWTMLMSQIKNILNENKNWSCSTIQYILYYMYEILELNLFDEQSKGSILNLVQYYGLEAEKYYNQIVDVEESVNNFNFNDDTVIVIKNHRNNEKKYKQIDINNL